MTFPIPSIFRPINLFLRLQDVRQGMLRLPFIATSLIVVAAVFCSASNAQTAQVTLTGIVMDQGGRSVVGATVTAVNTATKVAITGRVDGAGVYEIPYLPAGTYDVTAEAHGFKSTVTPGVVLGASDRFQVDITLSAGAVNETVTVSGTPPLLNVESATPSVAFEGKTLADLPLNSSGNADALAQFTPGVSDMLYANNVANPNAVSDITVSGTRAYNTEFLIDGAPVMEGYLGSYHLPPDAIQQTRFVVNNYDVSFGHSGGGWNSTTSRSGEDSFHGSLYEYHTDNFLLGLNFFQRVQLNNPATGPVTTAKLKQIKGAGTYNRYGVSLGGPVWFPRLYNGRGKTFFFFAYEATRSVSSNPNAGSIFTVPTVAERQGDFSALLAPGCGSSGFYQGDSTKCNKAGGGYTLNPTVIYDPLTVQSGIRTPFPGNIIPANRIDSAASLILKFYPLPTPNTGNAYGQNNYQIAVKSGPNLSEIYTGRVDQVFSERERLFGRFTYVPTSVVTGGSFDNAATTAYNPTTTMGAVLNNVYVVTPSFLVNLHYSFTRYRAPISTPPLNLTSDIGFNQSLVSQINPNGITFPYLNIDSAIFPLVGNNYPGVSAVNDHAAGGDLTKMMGRHSVQFGGEFRLFQNNTQTYRNGTPTLSFGTNYTSSGTNGAAADPIGGGLASFMLGLPTGGMLVNNSSYATTSRYFAGYVSDHFRVTSRVALDLGLRYEYETAPTERHNRVATGFDTTDPNPISAAAVTAYDAAYAGTSALLGSSLTLPAPGQFHVNGGLVFAGNDGHPRGFWTSDKNDFAPRAGIAFHADPLTVFRAGYGIFYEPRGVDRINSIAGPPTDQYPVNQTGFSATTSVSTNFNLPVSFQNAAAMTNPISTLENPFPSGLIQPSGASAGLGTNLGQILTFVYDSHQKNPLIQRWTAGFQRQLPGQIVFEATYAATYGMKLPTQRQLDIIPSQYLSTSQTRDQATITRLGQQVANPFYGLFAGSSLGTNKTTAVSQLLLPYPEFLGILYNDPIGTSNYNSGYALVQKKFQSGVYLVGSYTWSKFLQTYEYVNGNNGSISQPNLSPLHVISDQDVPQKFSIIGQYDLPVGRGRRFGSHLNPVVQGMLGDWKLALNWYVQSGTPLSGWGDALYFGDYAKITLPHNKQTVSQWFNTTACTSNSCTGFDETPADQLANNIQTFPLRLPGVRSEGQNDANASLSKYFVFSHETTFQFRTELLNLANHSQFTAPNTTPTNALFGQITSVTSLARSIYFVGKITF